MYALIVVIDVLPINLQNAKYIEKKIQGNKRRPRLSIPVNAFLPNTADIEINIESCIEPHKGVEVNPSKVRVDKIRTTNAMFDVEMFSSASNPTPGGLKLISRSFGFDFEKQ